MSNRRSLKLLSALFLVLLCVAPCFSQSSKETIINELTICQAKLVQAQASMNNSERQALILSDEIMSLQQQLQDSVNKSQATIDEISKQLMDSKALLKKSQLELTQQAGQLEKLSSDLKILKLKLATLNSLPWVITGATVVAASVIVYYERK